MLSTTRRRRTAVAVLATAAALCAGALTAATGQAAAAASPRLDGFTAAHSATERATETKFMKMPSAALAQNLDQQLSRETGLVGTVNDKHRADKIVARLRSFGLTPHVSTFYPYLSVPKKVSVQMTSPYRFTAQNKEPCYSFETDCKDVVVGYNALSPSGDVTAPIVYVNYGTVADYATLAKLGVSVKGKLVLARYGQVFRGVKTNLAAEHGAKGVIIYSDPKDDGYTNGPVYPNGPWRSPDGIQRGSVQELWQYAGDPLTPGYAATKNAPRIDPSKANLAKLPTAPISYGSAQPILTNLGGRKAPTSWQGGLPLTYRLGSGATVHLKLNIAYKIAPVYDITASIPGRTHPDEVVQLGAHHDAWTHGSDDNLSGAETVLQIARGLSTLLKQGWRPARTIELGTWDGEEYGLFGSTEYAESVGRSRLGQVVGYLNMDVTAGKYFGASSVPSMDRLIRDTTKLVPWPGTNGSLYDSWAKESGGTPTPERLGSGSDYTAFLDHFGVPAADLGSSTPSGDYHCSCDNYWMESHYIDPGWRYHVGIAQEVGLVTLRLADADIVPLHYTPYAAEVQTYLTDLQKQQQKVYGRQVVDLGRDIVAAKRWAAAATALQRQADRLLANGASRQRLDAVTTRLSRDERDLLTRRGLPGRPWYEHQIYAPGVNSGYGTQVLPGINDALFLRHRPAEARSYEASLHASLVAATHTLGG